MESFSVQSRPLFPKKYLINGSLKLPTAFLSIVKMVRCFSGCGLSIGCAPMTEYLCSSMGLIYSNVFSHSIFFI